MTATTPMKTIQRARFDKGYGLAHDPPETCALQAPRLLDNPPEHSELRGARLRCMVCGMQEACRRDNAVAIVTLASTAFLVVLCSCGRASYETEAVTGVQISYLAGDLGGLLFTGFRYTVVCAADETLLDDEASLESADPPERTFASGMLERVVHEISGTPTEVWGAFVETPAGVCDVTLTEGNDRESCFLSDRYPVPLGVLAHAEFSPVCAGRLCPPRGDLSVEVRLVERRDALTLDTALSYRLTCEGLATSSSDDACDAAVVLRGSVEMLGGPHIPNIGPIQDGRWRITGEGVPAGPCVLEAQGLRGGVASCEVTEGFEASADVTTFLVLAIDCPSGVP